MMKNISVIILSAGKGTRMKSELPKVMHKVAGREMLNMVIDEAKKLNPQNITLVVSPEMEIFYDKIKNEHKNHHIDFVIQNERKGTGHAVFCAISTFNNNKKLNKPYYFQDLIEKKDPILIVKEDSKEYNAYSRTCRSDERKQPVILTDAQLEKNNKEHPGI
jgi:bifunctional N-acetylglucosamine-1-phosphate-uridyltransferase/glucosamine-1-phosphate-acetyltransferase GlmU-like protein